MYKASKKALFTSECRNPIFVPSTSLQRRSGCQVVYSWFLRQNVLLTEFSNHSICLQIFNFSFPEKWDVIDIGSCWAHACEGLWISITMRHNEGWQLTVDMWHLIGGRWQVTVYLWHLTGGNRHLTDNIWHFR